MNSWFNWTDITKPQLSSFMQSEALPSPAPSLPQTAPFTVLAHIILILGFRNASQHITSFNSAITGQDSDLVAEVFGYLEVEA